MGLFGSRRDSGFMASVNREMLYRLLATEVLLYPQALEENKTSLYGDREEKIYYDPLILSSYIYREDVQAEQQQTTGQLETSQQIAFGFLREELEQVLQQTDDQAYVLSIGDVIRWDGGFYEISNIRKEFYWWGRNPNEFIAADRGAIPPQGWAYAVVVDTHRTAQSSVNIISRRT